MRPEISGFCLQGTDKIMPAGRIALMLQLKVLDIVVGKKIFQYHLGLRLTVAVAFYRKRQLNIVIKIFGQLNGITRSQGADDIIHRTSLCER